MVEATPPRMRAGNGSHVCLLVCAPEWLQRPPGLAPYGGGLKVLPVANCAEKRSVHTHEGARRDLHHPLRLWAQLSRKVS